MGNADSLLCNGNKTKDLNSIYDSLRKSKVILMYYKLKLATKNTALSLGLKLMGGTICYYAGMGVGEIMDQLPYVREIIPQTVDYLSNIDIAGNIDGLVALIGAATGIKTSGTELSEERTPKRIEPKFDS